MKRAFIAGCLAALLIPMHMTTANMPASVDWKKIGQALEDAPKQEKLILLDVYTDWCGWCKRMDRDTYADSTVVKYLGEKYISSKMNPEKQGELLYRGKKVTQREFGQALGINSYPSTAFFNEKGELLTVVPGYIGAKEFINILKFFGEGIYLNTSWEDYSKAIKEKS